jgi:hypothetical protein
VYAFSYSRYILADSTILDNGAVINLVNDKIKLEPGSFVRITGLRVTIEYGTLRLPIVGHGTRVLKRVFNQGKRDLVLNNVAVIKGFHTNIISEYKLRSSGVWYNGFDCTLRYGPLEKSVVLKKLERKYNLVFIELKPLSSSYSHAQIGDRLVSTLIFPTLKRKVRRLYRPLKDYLRLRSDSAQRWHDRTGHIRLRSLERLVH